ncbi:MAG: SGNH/GDSL hydrolase family protein [Brevinematales bacterium]|nr:SGNH/GDSL hydrolase family protein [Brevinematales bacterium]
MKKFIFNIVFTTIILLIFVLIEITLRVMNIGYNTEPFIRHPKIKEFYIDNRELRYKYYPKRIDLTRDPIKNIFLYNKLDGVLRGFVLGGSAAEGFPYYSNNSFSKILETGLNEIKKFKKVEIINLGFSAMSSYYVADVSKKLLKYKPDFVIIYSGHNEYYGTISATTGGGHIAKKIYLSLKELRIFQLIFEMLGKSRWKNIKTRTMMAEQFNNRVIPNNEKFDGKVAENYIKNIKETVELFTKNGVKVILIEPVCNLVSMPPFKGEDDEKLSNDIVLLYENILKGNKKNIDTKLFENTRNANLLYLKALYNLIYNKDLSISNFIFAKEMDIVPFRIRNRLVYNLRNFANSYKNTNFIYIPLEEKIFKNLGYSGFGNNYFIDHLHFNYDGHLLMANVIAEKISDIYNLNEQERKILINFLNDKNLVREKVYITPLAEFLAFRSILLLSKQPPYSEMLIKYHPSIDNRNPFLTNEASYKLQEDELFNMVINDFITRKDFKNAFFYMNSVLSIYPADPKNHLAMAELQRMVNNPEALYNYVLAYVLSDRNYNYYQKLESYLASQGQLKMIDKIVSLYGKPKQ